MKNQITFVKRSDVEADVYFDGRPCLGEVYVEVDGYWVWVPGEGRGFIDAWILRAIADLLDEWNKPWDEEVQKHHFLPAQPSMDAEPQA